MVNFDSSVVVIGGWSEKNSYSSSLYKLMCSHDECMWSEMGQKLIAAREMFVAMKIPDEMTNCTAKVRNQSVISTLNYFLNFFLNSRSRPLRLHEMESVEKVRREEEMDQDQVQ